jgi:hypothetical protein
MVVLAITQLNGENELKLKNDIKLETTRTKLEIKRQKFEEINKELEQTKNSDKQKTDRLNELEKEVEKLEKDLQAKLEAQQADKQRIASANPLRTQTAAAQSVNASGGCSEWMRQAGIPINNATRTLIAKESGCRPSAVNPSSGACGIPQAYPCSKLPCSLNEAGAVCQLQWMQNYVMQRYGSWESALSFWYSKCGSPQGCWY